MFGFGNRNRGNYSRNSGIAGILGGGGMRRAAVMGLGMMAYRWWRNRQAGGVTGQGSRTAQGQAWNSGNEAGRPMTQW
ncbi:MAG TPA: hypothetical protein VMY76_02010 [Gemmatimonadales bacterium]|nr:hypothetical protein [Gemmatimonadales bacterium]